MSDDKQPCTENRIALLDILETSLTDLLIYADKLNVRCEPSPHRHEVTMAILKKLHFETAKPIYAEGLLEIIDDDYGFIRSSVWNFSSSPYDIYLSPKQINKFKLYSGCMVYGQIRPPKENEKNFAMLCIDSINSIPAKQILENGRIPILQINDEISSIL